MPSTHSERVPHFWDSAEGPMMHMTPAQVAVGVEQIRVAIRRLA